MKNLNQILVAGDGPSGINLFCRALQFADFCYELAFTFDETVLMRKIFVIRPSLVILNNSHVPDKSGFHKCKSIRRFFPPDKGRLLFVGWYVSKINQDKIRGLGRADILCKPFLPKDLLLKIQFG